MLKRLHTSILLVVQLHIAVSIKTNCESKANLISYAMAKVIPFCYCYIQHHERVFSANMDSQKRRLARKASCLSSILTPY